MEPIVLIDKHEFRAKKRKNTSMLLAEMLEKDNKEFQIDHLEVGDIVYGNIAIERKTISDFLHSLKGTEGQNRLFRQMESILQYEYPYLLIEDYYRTIFDFSGKKTYTYNYQFPAKNNKYNEMFMMRRSSFNPKSLMGMIKKIENMGINIIYASGPKHAVAQIWQLFFPVDGPNYRTGTKLIRAGLTKLNDKELKVYIMSGIPGLSESKSTLILEHFDWSIIKALSNIEEWINIKGIGKKTVDQAKSIIL